MAFIDEVMRPDLPKVKQQSVRDLIDKEIVFERRGIEDVMLRFRNAILVRVLTLNDGNIPQTAKMLDTADENVRRWMREAGL
jgi:hypothetical protein